MRANGLSKSVSLMRFGTDILGVMAEYGKEYQKRKTRCCPVLSLLKILMSGKVMDKVFTSLHPVKKFIYNSALMGEHLSVKYSPVHLLLVFYSER